MRTAALAIAALLIVAGTRCGDASPTEPVDATPLGGTVWRLVSLEPGAPLIATAPPYEIPTLAFTRVLRPPQLFVSGEGPCNGFSGRYSATTEGAISIDSLFSTRRGCGEESGTLLEGAYFDRLLATTTWSVRADSLVLESSDERLLLFVRQ